MPYATVLLVANAIILLGLEAIFETASILILIYLALFLVLIFHLVLNYFSGVTPKKYLTDGMAPIIAGFATRSSMAALPITIETLKEKFKNNDGVASFTATLSTQIGMNGCAGIYPALMAIAVFNMYDIPITIATMITLIIAIVIGSIGLPGMPGTATTALVITLSIMGLDATQIAVAVTISVAIDSIVDMGRTAINVSGGMTASNVVQKLLFKKPSN